MAEKKKTSTPKNTGATKNYYVRLNEKGIKLLRMYAGELQLKTGDNVTDTEAVLSLFDTCRPDLVSQYDSSRSTNPESK